MIVKPFLPKPIRSCILSSLPNCVTNVKGCQLMVYPCLRRDPFAKWDIQANTRNFHTSRSCWTSGCKQQQYSWLPVSSRWSLYYTRNRFFRSSTQETGIDKSLNDSVTCCKQQSGLYTSLIGCGWPWASSQFIWTHDQQLYLRFYHQFARNCYIILSYPSWPSSSNQENWNWVWKTRLNTALCCYHSPFANSHITLLAIRRSQS